jgi:signal peptidase I
LVIEFIAVTCYLRFTMLTTSLFFLVCVGSLSVSIFLSAWLLKLGARWARIDGVGFKRALVVALFLEVAYLVVRGLVFTFFRLAIQNRSEQYPYAAAMVEPVLAAVAGCAVVQSILHTSVRKAILAWVPTLLATASAWVLAFAVIRPFLFEAFAVPTNAMAPTIVGRHLRGTCPSCGEVAFVSPRPASFPALEQDLGICASCMRASEVLVAGERVFPGDRLLAAKFLRPRRWDMIVFRNPEDPSVQYVSRLVGMPGDEVAIRDGAVWINGAVAQKPEAISSLVYVAHPAEAEKAAWGPVKPGRDEYVVLSDFSRRAKDSRVWETGAPGHPSYAVPESYVSGVVTHIYWPPSRWRTFR